MRSPVRSDYILLQLMEFMARLGCGRWFQRGGWASRCIHSSTQDSNFCRWVAPSREQTGRPREKIMKTGRPPRSNRDAIFRFSSAFTRPTRIRSRYLSATCSTIGAINLQYPHHSAQKSISTSWLFSTILSKFSESRSMIKSSSLRTVTTESVVFI